MPHVPVHKKDRHSMSEARIAKLEGRIGRIVVFGSRMQYAWMMLVLLIVATRQAGHYYFENYDWKAMEKLISVCALVSSLIVNRVYIHAGKRLEELKTFSEEEMEQIRREYFFRFFWTYFFWAACYGIFTLL